MRRVDPRPNGPPAPPAAAKTQGVVIGPTAVYLLPEVITIFRLRKSTIRRELREGRLRVCKRAGRYYFLGSQLLDWLRGGEVAK
jgi:hypothetical protein